MQKHLLYINLFAITSALALTACTDEVDNIITPDVPETGEKTPIELSVGGVEKDASTRSVVTTEKTDMISLTGGTHIFMLMKSEYNAFTGEYASLDYGGTLKTAKYTTTRGKVGADDKVLFEDGTDIIRTRYWDDAHARSSKLSIWALACDGLESLGGIGNPLTESSSIFYNSTDSYNAQANSNVAGNVSWRSDLINAKLIQWNVPHGDNSAQDEASVKNRDLLFSNNLADYTSTSLNTDNRLKFDVSASPKAFTGGKLVFYHALSKITINLKMGNGFTGTNGDFNFPASKNVKLSYFNIWGQFSAEDGEFLSVNNAHEVVGSIWNHTGTTPNTTDAQKPAYWLEANVLPYSSRDTKPQKGSQFTSTGTHVMMEFTIGNNVYKLTSKQLFEAIKNFAANNIATDATSIEMEAGKNYVFTFTISKTKIDNITASIVKWDEITAEAEPSNANPLTITMEKLAGTEDPVASYLYLSATTDENKAEVASAMKGYSNSSNRYELNDTKSKQEIAHYWPNNLTYYNLRTIAPKVNLTKDGTTDDNYLTLTGGAVNNNNDYIWGAPLQEKHSTTPHSVVYDNSKGYSDYLYPAIGATKDNIHITQFHMMSDIEINLSTTAEGQPDRVDLSNATVSLTSFANTAQLMIGNGLVTNWGSIITTQDITAETAGSKYSWRVVPQELKRTGTNEGTVGILITTADNNVYKITDLSTLPVKIGEQTNQIIPTWMPGTKYIYNLKLTKTKIENITATIVDWNTIEANYDNVQIQ